MGFVIKLYQGFVFKGLHSEFLFFWLWLIVIGVSCGKPPVRNGATILGASYLYQDQVIYSCPPGKLVYIIWFNARRLWSDLSMPVQTDEFNIF
jgi:hypothetical protein